MSFSPRAVRLMKAVEEYTKNCKRFEALCILNKVKVTSAKEGCIAGTFAVTEDICNIGKFLHGGFTASVIDIFSLLGIVSHDKGVLPYTTDMNILYVGMGKLGDLIKVETKPISFTKSRVVMECILFEDIRKTTIAKGTVGFLLSNPPKICPEFPFDQSQRDD